MGEYLLSIDNGLTAIKVVLFDVFGREIASGSARTPVLTEGDRSEIDMSDLWEMTADLIHSVIRSAGIDPGEIRGIGNSGHGGGLYLVDARHQPVRRAITSMDARALPLLTQWQTEGRTSQDILHQELWGGQTIPLLAWLKKHEPASLLATAWILSAKDWIIERLTGIPGIEESDGSNAGLISPVSRQVEPELLNRFDLADCVSRIPPLRKSTDPAGHLTLAAAERTGLRAGTPVAGGAFDCAACALGSGIVGRNSFSIIAGTWNINAGIDPQLRPRTGTTKCSLFPDGQQYFYVESSATSAVNLDWFIRNVMQKLLPENHSDRQIYAQINAWVASVQPTGNDLVYLPFLYPSGLANHLQASLIGLRPEHSIRHILAAIYEGVAFAHRMHLERLMFAGIRRDSVLLTGGAANSSVWCQLFADVLGLPVTTGQATQTGALGAAMCAAVAIGRYAGFDEATRQMVRPQASYLPHPDLCQIYDQKYQRFHQIVRQLEINQLNQEQGVIV